MPDGVGVGWGEGVHKAITHLTYYIVVITSVTDLLKIVESSSYMWYTLLTTLPNPLIYLSQAISYLASWAISNTTYDWLIWLGNEVGFLVDF